MRVFLFFWLLTLLALSGCVGDEVRQGTGGGQSDASAESGVALDSTVNAIIEDADPWGVSCAESAKWVYVVEFGNKLSRYYPSEHRFEDIGMLNCPSASSPFSMAVDRDGNAWISYSDNKLYKASVEDASCESTGYVPRNTNFQVFGMGFATKVGSDNEDELFLAGSPNIGSLQDARFGKLNVEDLTISEIGTKQMPGNPEFTGNAVGDLWGYFPDVDGKPIVAAIDKEDGTLGETFNLEALAGGSPLRWAFAFWGGKLHIFYKSSNDDSTNVWELDPKTGDVVKAINNSGRQIVGAGVSTCAPLVLL